MMTVSQRYESSVTPSGIITLNTAWINDETIERFSHKRIYGRIEACPLMFTEKVVEIEDIGIPIPRKHIPSEYIEEQRRSGLRKFTQKHYSCAGLDEFDVITKADIANDTDIRRFDKVYFDPRVTEPENLLGSHNGHELYKVSVEEIICVVRNGEILMQGGWCLVEPEMESWQEIQTERGIYIKPHPEAKALRGFIRHYQHRDDLNPGDRIVFMKGADWTVKIEGKDYYAIHHTDIMCKL